MLGKPSGRTRKKLEERGKRAQATVLDVGSRGMAVTHGAETVVANTEIALKVKLRVEPDDEPAFEVQERFRFPQLSVPSAGMRLAVIYDPQDHGTIMLDDSPGAAIQIAGMPGVDTQAMLAQVQQAQAESSNPQELAQKLQQQFGAGAAPAAFGATGFGTPAPPAAAEDPVDKLAKLADLKEKGLLTDSEFESQKARILGES